MVQLSHPHMTSGKIIALTIGTFVSKMTALLFITLSRFVTAFLPRSKCLLISCLQSPSIVTLEPRKIKCVVPSTFFASIHHEVMGLDAMNFIFLMLSFKPAFSLSSFTLIKRLLTSSSLSAIKVVSSEYLRLFISRTYVKRNINFLFFYFNFLLNNTFDLLFYCLIHLCVAFIQEWPPSILYFLYLIILYCSLGDEEMMFKQIILLEVS